jgi:hypothetical protein
MKERKDILKITARAQACVAKGANRNHVHQTSYGLRPLFYFANIFNCTDK